MATLLSTAKLAWGSPNRSVSFKTERFQTDSYSIRASVGINPIVNEYDLTWAGLTAAEMTALVTQLDGTRGVDTVDWQPPGAASSQKFTVMNYTVTEYPGPTAYYSVQAKLMKEYDL